MNSLVAIQTVAEIERTHGSLVCDSRGLELSIDDLVFYSSTSTSVIVRFLGQRRLSYARGKRYLNMDDNSFIFNIKGHTKSYITMLEELCDYCNQINTALSFEAYNYNIERSVLLRYQMLKARYGTDDIGMFDYLGRDVLSGDLVYYKTGEKSISWKLGVVIGYNQILTECLEKIICKVVLKLDTYTNQEIEAKRKLSNIWYRISVATHDLYECKQRGALYYYSNRYYLYLGKFELKECKLSNGYEFSYHHDRNVDYWCTLETKFNVGELDKALSCGNSEFLSKYLSLAINTGVQLIKDIITRNNQFRPIYRVVDINTFKDCLSVRHRAGFLGNLNMPPKLLIDFKDLDGYSKLKKHYSFEFIF